MEIAKHCRRSLAFASVCLSLASIEVDAAEPARLSDLRGIVEANLNHDASRIVVRTRSGGLGLWETKKGTQVSGDAALTKPAQGYVMSADGRKVLVGFKDGHARVFDTSSGAAASPVLSFSFGESDNPPAVFSPDGNTFVFFGEKNTSLIEVKSGKKLVTLPFSFGLEEGSGSTASAIFANSGAKCFLSTSGATVTAYETKKWTALGKPMDHPPAEKAYTFGFNASSDGKWIVTFDDPGENGPKGNLQVWDASTSKPLGEPVVGENGMSGRFIPGQDRVLLGAGRGDATVRDLPSMAVSYEVKKHDELDGPEIAVFPNGKWFLAWGSDKRIDLIDAITGKTLNTYSSPAAIRGVMIPNDSTAFYLAFDNSSTEGKHEYGMERLSVPDLKMTGSAIIPDYLLRQSLSPDGRWILILQGGSDEESVVIFDALTLKPIEWPKP